MTSKSALIRFTECLAIEAKPFGVSAFAMGPGTVRTALSEHALTSAEGQQWLPWFRRVFDEGLDLPVERPARLAQALASGNYDELSGLTVTPLDDLDAMRAALTTIDREKLYSLRVRTLPTSGASSIAAVRRAAEQPRDLAIRIERAFPVGPEVVFEAWTNSAAIAEWFLPSTDAHWIDPPISDPRPDGLLNLLAEVRGERYHLFGRYRTVVPLRTLSLDWSWRDLPIIGGAGDTTLNLRFEASSGGCLVVLAHADSRRSRRVTRTSADGRVVSIASQRCSCGRVNAGRDCSRWELSSVGRDPCASWSRNLETPARVRRQHCYARCVRPPVLLRPRRTGRPAGTTDELLDLTKCHAELLRGPRRLLATAAHVDIESELPRRATDGQLIQHPVRGALQTIRFPHSSDRFGKVGKRRLPNREGDDGVRAVPVRSRCASMRRRCGPRLTAAPAR